MDAIKKGNLINIDLTKVTLDSQTTVYSLINSSLGFGAYTTKNAVGKKKCFGAKGYDIQIVIELVRNKTEMFDMEIDDKLVLKNFETSVMMVFNSKFGAGKVYVNPLGIINDGHFEVLLSPKKIGTIAIAKIFTDAKKGGIHAYDNSLLCYRCKKLKLTNKSTMKDKKTGK